jgi:hypothetical protein
MNPGFDTKEEAQAWLKIRQDEALKRLQEEGEVVLGDSSHVFFDCQTTGKWTGMLLITTQSLLDDLKNMQFGMDLVEDMERKLIEEASNINKEIIQNIIKSSNEHREGKNLD